MCPTNPPRALLSQEQRAKVVTAHQLAMMPLEEQLEGLQKAIITARGLKRRNIQSEIEVLVLPWFCIRLWVPTTMGHLAGPRFKWPGCHACVFPLLHQRIQRAIEVNDHVRAIEAFHQEEERLLGGLEVPYRLHTVAVTSTAILHPILSEWLWVLPRRGARQAQKAAWKAAYKPPGPLKVAKMVDAVRREKAIMQCVHRAWAGALGACSGDH
jgi:hypothetical protein